MWLVTLPHIHPSRLSFLLFRRLASSPRGSLPATVLWERWTVLVAGNSFDSVHRIGESMLERNWPRNYRKRQGGLGLRYSVADLRKKAQWQTFFV